MLEIRRLEDDNTSTNKDTEANKKRKSEKRNG